MQKPIQRVPNIPDPDLHKQLRAELKKRYGMSDRAAGAISTIWTDPGAVLAQLASPQRRRIPGAELRVISGQVYTARLIPDPLNPRNADEINYPLAQAKGTTPAILGAASTEGVGEMSMRATTRAALAEHLDAAIDTTMANNTPHPEIAEQGIMDPPIGVATTIFYENADESPTTHIIVREGSSRTSHGLYHLGVSADDVLFQLPRNASVMQKHIDDLNAYAKQAVGDISESEKAALRCAVTNFELIIDVVPDVPGTVDLDKAIKARVAQDHLNIKKKWSDSSKFTSLGEECLASALAEGILSEPKARWLAGQMTQREAADAKLTPYLDDRAAQIVYLFTTSEPKVHHAIRKPIAFSLIREEDRASARTRKNVTFRSKLPLGVEMVARELRGRVSETELAAFRKAFEATLPVQRSTSNWKPVKRSPEALYQAAAKELAEEAEARPASTELGVRATYVLVKHRAIGGARHDLGEGADRRPPAVVMEQLLESEHGLHQLRQALEDDRAGLHPRQVDAQGILRQDATGEYIDVDNAYLRTVATTNSGPGEGDDSDNPEQAAQQVYKDAVRAARDALGAIDKAVRNLDAITDEDGVKVVTQWGLGIAKLLTLKLQDLADLTRDWRDEASGTQADFGVGDEPEAA